MQHLTWVYTFCSGLSVRIHGLSTVNLSIFLPEMTKKDKEPTVFIDLRNFDQLRQEQQQSIEKVQKVLGIDPNERFVITGLSLGSFKYKRASR